MEKPAVKSFSDFVEAYEALCMKKCNCDEDKSDEDKSDEYKCDEYQARFKLRQIWNEATEENARRIELAGVKISVFGIAASIVVGQALSDPRIMFGGAVLSSVIGTVVSASGSLKTSGNLKRVAEVAREIFNRDIIFKSPAQPNSTGHYDNIKRYILVA